MRPAFVVRHQVRECEVPGAAHTGNVRVLAIIGAPRRKDNGDQSAKGIT